ncbi:hypothetical protein B0A48_10053 [Cryoendolithus antarcticus]|uniref:Choline kinase N-terminal domain-containing protein n=1 Tax=Cryoendolithus antarcticus TaxID=1507870 RepID=A0A1V8T3G3_9PEZI|nr:hypothetical protein B0A48_10053 [Cryoendolithus antarcticus]
MSPSSASPKPGILKQDPVKGSDCASPSSYLGLHYAASPKTTPKSVSIDPNAETISPMMLAKPKQSDEYFSLDGERAPRRPLVKGPSSHRLSGRPSTTSLQQPASGSLDGASQSDERGTGEHEYRSRHVDHVLDEVSSWVAEEKAKRSRRKERKQSKIDQKQAAPAPATNANDSGSDSDLDLSRLEEIMKRIAVSKASRGHRKHSLRSKLSSISLKHGHKRKGSTAGGSSDTEYVDGDVLVPSCDAILDNSKTVAQPGGASDASDDDDLRQIASYRDTDAWAGFKFEIVRLTHTLRLKGWRRVPMDMSGQITVDRLSGALTNAVYVVSPPSELPARNEKPHVDGSAQPVLKKPPPKLLLRIYGPQVEHLIDRDSELQILRRLARKRIGPRMLGTFGNGRFEEYFHALALTPEELRSPDVSRQIAKRMRELHDGIELLDRERNDGPFVWLNWDKWVQRVEQVVLWMDNEVKSMPPGVKPTGSDTWKRRGLICGVEWHVFRAAVEKYRDWLQNEYGSAKKVSEQLVFAHNDTQYGNILRLVPTDQSPLLLPANSHKQLIVIDFEYANANVQGLEFANHFTEWCYNYHDEKKPYACNTNRYPTPEEQDRFVRAYVRHRPQFNVTTPMMKAQSPAPSNGSTHSTPKRTTSSISAFMLDARNPSQGTQATKYDDAAEKSAEDAEVKRLLHETRLWRIANTAQWVAWGIVQAKIDGLPDFSDKKDTSVPGIEDDDEGDSDSEYKTLAKLETHESEAKEEEDEEFDYLGYAQHRAMFFWGDMLQMGLVKGEDLPEGLVEKVKTVTY